MFSTYEEAMTGLGLFVAGLLIGIISQRVKFTWK
jgi:hypothetical protein